MDSKSVMGAKILEFDSGDLLAIVTGIIVDPDTGMVEAFWVKPTTLSIRDAVLKPSDILEFKKKIYIKSDRVLALAEDVIRISSILEDGRTFLGSAVQNEAGDSYGKCVGLSFDTNTYALKQIRSKRSILGIITLDERLFSYGSIIKVLPEVILVNDDATKKEILIATTPEVAAS